MNHTNCATCAWFQPDDINPGQGMGRSCTPPDTATGTPLRRIGAAITNQTRTLMPPLKPEVCIEGDRVAVFLGADYKHLTLDQADVLISKLQSLAAALRRKQKRERRAGKAA